MLLESVDAWSSLHKAATEVCLVIEDTSDKSSRRSATHVSTKASKLNEGIRRRFLSATPADHSHGKGMISRNMGRPPWWFMDRVCRWLQQHESSHKVIVIKNGYQADDYVISWVKELKTNNPVCHVSVVATDRDFLVFSKADRIVFKEDGLRKSLERQKVLNELKLSEDELFYAYLLSGCDDVATKLKGVGFATASRIVGQAGHMFSLNAFRKTESMKKEWDKSLSDLWAEIKKLRTRHATKPETMLYQQSAPTTLPTQSLLELFINERNDQTNEPRRQKLKELYEQRKDVAASPKGKGVDPRRHREMVATKRAKTFTSLFLTPNAYEILRGEDPVVDDPKKSPETSGAAVHTVAEPASDGSSKSRQAKEAAKKTQAKTTQQKPKAAPKRKKAAAAETNTAKKPKLSQKEKIDLKDTHEELTRAIDALEVVKNLSSEQQQQLNDLRKQLTQHKAKMSEENVRARGSAREFKHKHLKPFLTCTRPLGLFENLLPQELRDLEFGKWVHGCVTEHTKLVNGYRRTATQNLLELVPKVRLLLSFCRAHRIVDCRLETRRLYT